MLAVPSAAAMKVINTNQLVKIPEGVEASVKSRVVTVKVRRLKKLVFAMICLSHLLNNQIAVLDHSHMEVE